MSEEFGPNIVTVIDDETGEEIELEFVDALEYNGTVYRAFFPMVGEDDEGEDEEIEFVDAEDIEDLDDFEYEEEA